MNDRALSAMIEVRGTSKSFGPIEALVDVDLVVEAGTVHALLGPNGAGKSTLVRILCTLTRPSSGQVRIAGLDVMGNRRRVRRHIGVVGQFPTVDEGLSGRENLRLVGRLSHLGRYGSRYRADELLERFDLVDAADRRVSTYSGGMRRRLDLAAGLVNRPPVLLLDEPTSGLDPRARRDLWRHLDELVVDGTTILLTTQHLEEAERLAHHVTVLHRGRVAACDTTARLKTRFGRTVITLSFTDRHECAAASAALDVARLVGVPGGHPTKRRVYTGEASVAIPAIVRALDGAGITASEIDVGAPSLDDVMMELTGERRESADVDERAGT